MTSAGSVSDWLRQLQAGDRDAVEELWRRYYHRLVRLARKKLLGLLCELLPIDLTYRARLGEALTPQEYRQRFPGHDDLIRAAFAELTRFEEANAGSPFDSAPLLSEERLLHVLLLETGMQ